MKQQTYRFAVVCIFLIALAGCASNVSTDYDSQAPFATYDTYAFEPGQSREVQSLDASRVRSAVAEAMQSEGYEQVAPEQADLWVRFRFEEQTRYESSGFGYGLGLFNSPFGFGLSTRPEARPVMLEQLVVELVEPESNQVVWKGLSHDYLSEKMQPAQRTELIGELITRMFERYPPE